MASLDEVLAAVEACWCDQLGDSVAQCCLTASRPQVVDCCAGFGWVRLVGGFPSTAFPEANSTPSNCRIDTWAAVVEVGVARCAPVPCDGTGNSCCASEREIADALLDDISRFRRLFKCCLVQVVGSDDRPILKGQDIVVGNFETRVNGDCSEFVGQATLFVSDACSC